MKKHYPRAWIENHYHAICADWHGQKNMRTDFSVCCSVLCSQLIAFCVETHHILREGVRERDRERDRERERENCCCCCFANDIGSGCSVGVHVITSTY